MAPDRDHFHHHLQSKFGWPLGLLAYLAIALIPPAASFVGYAPATAGILIAIFLYATAIAVTQDHLAKT